MKPFPIDSILAQGLIDVRDPVAISSSFSTPFWLIAGVIPLIATAALVFWTFRKNKKELELTPGQIAMRRLNLFEQDGELGSGDWYAGLYNVLRFYLRDEKGLDIFDKTMQESSFLLQERNIFSSDVTAQVIAFMEVADLVKFANESVDLNQSKRHLDLLKRVVES